MTGLTELPSLNHTRFSPARIVAVTGSTNADLLAMGRDGAPEGAVLVTDHQTAGRGRQQRTWHDDPGNALLVSVLLLPERAVAPLMPLVVGIAAVEALAHLAEDLGADPKPAGLKWPNDVLAPSLGERKLAGILSESTTASNSGATDGGANQRLIVVPGMGMNLRWTRRPPAEVVARAATVRELFDVDVERDVVLELYLRHLERWLRVVETAGAAPLLHRYRHHCLTLGRQVRFATTATVYSGTAVDISSGGMLLLQTEESGVVELNAGDAHHVAAGDSVP